MIHPVPPPYVPPEYRHCTHKDMPEPYKTQIDTWIKTNTKIMEANAKGALAMAVFGSLMIVSLLIMAVIGAIVTL